MHRGARTQIVARGVDLAGGESGLGRQVREASSGEPVDHPLSLEDFGLLAADSFVTRPRSLDA